MIFQIALIANASPSGQQAALDWNRLRRVTFYLSHSAVKM